MAQVPDAVGGDCHVAGGGVLVRGQHFAEVLRHSKHEKGIEYLFVTSKLVPVSLKGDPLRLSQILINLVNNAIKFEETDYTLEIINNQELVRFIREVETDSIVILRSKSSASNRSITSNLFSLLLFSIAL